MNKTINKKELQNLISESKDKGLTKSEIQKIISEVVSGEKATKKAQKTSDDQNKTYYKDVEGKMSDYDKNLKQEDEDAIKTKKDNIEGDDKEYHDDMEIRNGQEMVTYDREPSDMFKDRAKKSLEGDSTTGNKTYEGEWNPETGEGNGNTEEVWGSSGGKHHGEEVVKNTKRSKEKRNNSVTPTEMFGDDIEVADGKPKIQKRKIATENMKRITFKRKKFDGALNALNALKLIPESFKVDGKVFEIADNNDEVYRIKWEGTLSEGRPNIIYANSTDLLNEDFDRMKKLMGYKAQNTLGVLSSEERIQENNRIKSRVNLISEGKGDADKDYDGDGKLETPEEEYLGSKDKAIDKAMNNENEEINEKSSCDDKKTKKESY